MTFAAQFIAAQGDLPNAEAADRCKVSERTVQRWRSGKGNPSEATQVGALAMLDASGSRASDAEIQAWANRHGINISESVSESDLRSAFEDALSFSEQ